MTAPVRASDIVFTRYGGRRGAAWLGEAYRMFRQAPFGWLVLMAVYWIIVALSSLTPLTQLLFLVVRPVFAVGLLAAAWGQERGGRPLVSDLFRGFQANLRALVALGAIFVAGIFAALMLTQLFDGGLLLDLVRGQAPAAGDDAAASSEKLETLIRSGRVQRSMLIVIALSMPVVLALWYAPALVVFQDASARTALGASLRAALANWRALAVYLLVVAAVGLLLPLLLARVVVMALPTPTVIVAAQVALAVFGVMFQATLHISDYVSYRDVFHAGETLAPLGRTDRSRK
jgi:hypothetical protein